MKRPVWFGVVFLSFALATLSGSRVTGAQAGIGTALSERGAWCGSKSLTQTGRFTGRIAQECWSSREMATCRCKSCIETRDGTSAGPTQYAQGGYEASFGRYKESMNARTLSLSTSRVHSFEA